MIALAFQKSNPFFFLTDNYEEEINVLQIILKSQISLIKHFFFFFEVQCLIIVSKIMSVSPEKKQKNNLFNKNLFKKFM